ncbi:MAG: hydantoinase B/oxoprolinase family protein, partial [Vicinamibacterales bacterium]|nr:hydantoinase B/oxoprolinase family protein [Vicinamibacterales bacterium]
MLSDHEPRSSREELVRVIRQVRNRWRLKIALRGSAIMVTAGVIAFLLSAYGLEYFRFSAPAIIAFRLLTYVGLTGLLIWSLVLPLARRVTDERVALYLEEHEPSLQAALVSALEESGKPNALERADMSPALIRQLIMVAVEKCRTVDSGRGVERQSLQRSSVVLAGLAAAALALFLFGPGYLRHGLSALAFPTSSVEAASPYKIVVAPGDATIARGADQVVTAQLDGFQAEDVELYSRADANVPFEPLPLVPSLDGDAYEVMLFDVAEPTEYFVQSSGIRSPVYTLEVVDVPFVGRLELEYHFPAYTGLPPRTIENGGDVAALRGTEVRVRAVPTMGTPAGQLVMDEETVLSLAREADGSFTTSFTIDADGFFRIDLEDPNGTMVTASAQYTIDVLDDQPPVVGFGKPGRDTTASPVEEIFVEAKADDDFGVRSLELVYSVNGGEEEVLSLLDDPDSALHNVAAGHTFFLEEFELEPGDFYINNDPFEGGQHLPDVFLYSPVFFEGRVVGFGATVAHHLDLGGGAPGLNMEATDYYQEGLLFPPSKYNMA